MIARPFPFNAFYGEDRVPRVDGDSFRLEVSGLVADRHAWTLAELRALPQTDQVTRHICVEGWSAIGKWTGVRLSEFLRRIGADTTAKYVHFVCAEGYSVSIDMPTALHAQTQMTFRFDDEILPTKFGFPMRIRMPTKLGFKNPKHVIGLAVLNTYTGGYWEDRGYNWFSGL
jgi:DMSO/TMAO reductase YedYZ molybdopterin-dependent catalytic subunit